MNKPTPEALQNFFSSDIFQSESVKKGDYTQVIAAFYDRFFSELDQSKYKEIGVCIDHIRREKLILGEEVDMNDVLEYKVVIDFHFVRQPENKQSFSLIGNEEEKAFYDLSRKELLEFFILKFRRFNNLFIH